MRKKAPGLILIAICFLCGCGKSPSSLTTPKGPPPAPVAAVPSDHVFDLDGFSAKDLSHGDGAMKLVLSREWKGASVHNGGFGPGWSDGNFVRLSLVDRDLLLVYRGEAGWLKAHRTGAKIFEGDGGEKFQQNDNGWTAQTANGTSLTFDSNGRLTALQLPNSPACSYSYDKNGRLASVGTGKDNLLRYAFDSSGKRIAKVDGPEGLRLDYTYDAKGKLASVINARRLQVTYTYNDDGSLTTAIDQFGNRLDLSKPVERTNTRANASLVNVTASRAAESKTDNKKYDAFGRVTNTTGASGQSVRFEYNNLDLPTLIATNGETERRKYDEHGMLLRRERDKLQWEEFSYDDRGRVATKRTAPGLEQRYEYDSDDRVAKIKYSSGAEVTYDYEPGGKVVGESWSTGEKRHWNYNADGQLVEFVDENGLRITYGYDTQGRLSYSEDHVHGRKLISYSGENEVTTETPDLGRSVAKTTAWGKPLVNTQPGDRKTVFRYDKGGNLAGVISPSDAFWAYENDGNARLNRIKSPGGLISVTENDEAGRLRRVTRGNTPYREYRYDNLGRVQQQFSSAGSTATYKYDDDGRITETSLPDGKASWSYTKSGSKLSGPGYDIEESYHPDGALARRSYNPAKLEVRLPRDDKGRAAGVELNDLKTSYVYNERGQIEQIKLPHGAIKISRDEAGRPTNLTLAETGLLEIKYDRADRITRIEAKEHSGKALFSESYRYDTAGNIQERATDSQPATRFEYDRDDRLTKVTDPKATNGLSYDVDGNLTAKKSGNQTSRFGLDELGRPTRDGAASYSWNTAGNLEATETAKVKTQNTFDVADRLAKRTVGDATWTFGYLPNGDRLWKERSGKRRWYAYLPDRLIAIKDEADVNWLLVSLPGTDWPIAMVGSNGKTLFVLADRIGSARRFVDESGKVISSADYSPFGILRASSGTAPMGMFAGMIFENTGLCYARQRYYEPEIGRFISLDPEIGTPGNPAAHNPYAYAASNPLRYRDPLGTDFASEVAASDSNLFHCLTDAQQAAVKEAYDGAQRVSRLLNSPMKSTPSEIVAASRHLEECNAALAQMNQIARARYKYVLLATGPTEGLSEAGKAAAARNTAQAKAAMEAMGEMPRVGRVNLGLNAENLGSTLSNVRPDISPNRALVPQGPTGMGEAGTATRGAGAGTGGGGASPGWDEGLFTGQSPIDKMGRPKGEIPMTYNPKTGVWESALPRVPSGSASSFATGAEQGAERWLGPKILNAGGKVLQAAGPILQVLNAIEAARLGGTMAKNYIDTLNSTFARDQANKLSAQQLADELAEKMRQLAASDPNAVILGDGRKFDPNNPDDLNEILQNLSQNLYFGRKPLDGILKYIPKLDPNVLPKTYMGPAPGDTAFDTSLENARKLLQDGYAAEKTAREAAAELAKQEAEAQSQLQSAMTTAGARAVVESDVATAPDKVADLKAQTAAVQAQAKLLQTADSEMRAAIAKCDDAATKICDYAARAASASEGEIASWRKEATNDLSVASNNLNSAQAKIDGADVSIDSFQTAIATVDSLRAKLAIYKGASVVAEKTDLTPDAALAAAKTASQEADTARGKVTSALSDLHNIVSQITTLMAPYIATDVQAGIVNSAANGLGKGIEEPGVFNFNALLSMAMPVIDAAIANQKAVEKAIGNVDLDAAINAAREVISTAQALRNGANAIASGVERYRPLQTASQCFGLIKVVPKVAEETPSPTPADEEVIVPDVSVFSGLTEMKAVASHAGLVPALVATTATPRPDRSDFFVTQDPLPNTKVAKGTPLKIIVAQKAAVTPTPTPEPTVLVKASPTPSPSPSSDSDMVVVPPVKDAGSIDYARTILNQAGFKSAFRALKPEKKEDELSIAYSNPAAGENAPRGSLVVVFIYQKFEATAQATPGPSPSESDKGVPRVLDLTLEQASTKLERAGLSVGGLDNTAKTDNQDKVGKIFEQTPSAGAEIPRDKRVSVKIYGSLMSKGPAPTPDPLGQMIAGPERELVGEFEGEADVTTFDWADYKHEHPQHEKWKIQIGIFRDDKGQWQMAARYPGRNSGFGGPSTVNGGELTYEHHQTGWDTFANMKVSGNQLVGTYKSIEKGGLPRPPTTFTATRTK